MSLPIMLLTLFALGILLIDLLLPAEWKWMNAVTALVGILFSAGRGMEDSAWHCQQPYGLPVKSAFLNSLVVDHFAIYFWYLFLAGAAIAILMSVRYMEIEHENHGEYYSLILFSVVGMMCMAAGFDIVLIFIGLELMAISTYVLVGFLRRDRRSNEAALKYLLLGAFSSGIFAYGLVPVLRIDRQHQPAGNQERPGSPGCGSAGSHRPDRGDRVADHGDRTVLQDCSHSVSSVAARRVRRRADQRHRLHVGGGKGGGLGDAAAHFPLGAVPASNGLCAVADFRCHRDDDRRQSGGADPEQPEAAAGVFVDRARRLHAAGPGRLASVVIRRRRFLTASRAFFSICWSTPS